MGQWLYAGLYHEMYMGFFSLSKEAGKGRASEGSAIRREMKSSSSEVPKVSITSHPFLQYQKHLP